MDNTKDPLNPTKETALDIPSPSAIELVETETSDVSETIETSETVDEMPDEENTETTPGYHSAMSRLELESLIQRYMDDVEKLKNEIRTQKDMYNAAFESDAAYSQADDVSKEAKRKVAEVKQRITQQPAVKDAQGRMNELKDEMKDVHEAISGLAEQYQQIAGTNQIVQEDGQILEIVRNFKVIRKKS